MNKKKNATLNSQLSTRNSQDAATARQLVDQYEVVIASEKSCFRERVKFGAMLLEWERYLGEARGGEGGTSGEGLKGWLERNCPEIGYNAAMEYKGYAQKALAMLGNSAQAVAALLGRETAVQPDGAVVDVPSEVITRREEIFAKADSRRKLEQMYWESILGAGKKKPLSLENKRKIAQMRAETGDGLTAGDAATKMWMEAMKVFEQNRATFHSAARDLNAGVAARFLGELEMLVDVLKKCLKR